MSAPQIGFEMESVNFLLKGEDFDTLTDPFLLSQNDKTKGQILHFFTANGEPDPTLNLNPRNNWIPTAEVQHQINSIQLEMIYGGPTGVAIATSVKELGTVGEQMCAFLQALDAQARDGPKPPVTQPKDGGGKAFMRPANLLTLSQTHKLVRWEITKAATATALGFHATAPIPLAALPGLLNVRNNPTEILFGSNSLRENMTIVTPEQVRALNFSLASIQWRAAAGRVYGENSVAGLLVMIMSYVNKSDTAPLTIDSSLKKKTPLMPRTDFTTMLNIVTELMVEASATAFRQNLVAIVQSIKGGSSLQNCFFNWASPSKTSAVTAGPPQAQSAPAPPPPPPPPPQRTPGAPLPLPTTSNTTPVVQPWNLNVQTWLEDIVGGKADQLALKDAQFRNKQIGALANKVETLIGNESLLCPILEFRGIGSRTFEQFQAKPSNFMQQLAARVEYWHQQALSGQ